MKQKLMSQSMLQWPDFSKEFILITGASNDGAGTVLSQGKIDKDLVIAFASCSFYKAENNTAQQKKNSWCLGF
jgi:hypothetical protein